MESILEKSQEMNGKFRVVLECAVTHGPWGGVGFYQECDVNPLEDSEQGMNALISVREK